MMRPALTRYFSSPVTSAAARKASTAFNAIYLIPKFAQLYGMPLESIVEMGHVINPAINSVSTLALFAVVPMNLLKGSVVSVVTILVYKKLSPILHKG